MFDFVMGPELIGAFVTLTVLEIVLGIDNIIFITILTGRLPPHQQARGRSIGLSLAMVTRIALLFCLTWVMQLTENLFTIFGKGISGRDIILLGGGAFLMAKATTEIHNSLEHEEPTATRRKVGFVGVMVQIALVDIVFSFDSVITAVGLVDELAIMVFAVVTSVIVMMLAATTIADFVANHPTIKMLALSFLILIGLMLMAESFDVGIPKGYVYFAMAFSFGVEILNIRARVKRRRNPIRLRKAQLGDLIETQTIDSE